MVTYQPVGADPATGQVPDVVKQWLDGIYQPKDTDLSAIAALATTAFGRGLLTLADAGAALATLGAASTTALGAKADATAVANALALKADASAVSSALALKADLANQWGPADYGYKAWVCDPVICQGNVGLGSSGAALVLRFKIRVTDTYSKAYFSINTAGASLTNVGAGLADANGNTLTSVVNSGGATTAAFQTTGVVEITFPNPQNLAAGTEVLLYVWCTGTTAPSLSRAGNQLNVNGRLANARSAKTTTQYTNAAPASLGAMTDPGSIIWGALA